MEACTVPTVMIPGQRGSERRGTAGSQKIDKNKRCIYCQKGEMSVPAAEALLEAGVDARSHETVDI